MNCGRAYSFGAAAVVLAALFCGQALSSDKETAPQRPVTKRADFAQERAPREIRQFADWVVNSSDHKGLPFVIVDKPNARVFVFDSSGRIRGDAAALLGSAPGDHSVPGIGERELSDMAPEDRTTPAGRFVAAIGNNFRGEDVLWVDYDSGLSMHRVLTTKPEERRLERLATPTSKDNRISYGCINVPKKFYENIVAPTFSGTEGIVYILPELGSARKMFGTYSVEEPVHLRNTAHPMPARKKHP
jgi:hypothetical protein